MLRNASAGGITGFGNSKTDNLGTLPGEYEIHYTISTCYLGSMLEDLCRGACHGHTVDLDPL
jgi:hypothetical protein